MTVLEAAQAQHEKTIAEAFEEFHAENPHVYRKLRELALGLVDRGHRKLGIGMLFEVLRWQTMMETTDPSGFKLNNNYRALYARLLMDREPLLEDVFETRSLHAPGMGSTALSWDEGGQGALL